MGVRFFQRGALCALLAIAVMGAVRPPPDPHAFMVRSFDGVLKCLDYRDVPSGGAAPGPGPPSVFLNDCKLSHPIVVEELQNGRHEVVLHAGAKIIGIRPGSYGTTGGTPGGAPSPASGLGLLSPLLLSDHIFALDGDSIILASSRPCMSTDTVLCPPAPPELVVQVENARGSNGTAIVLGPRRLIDPEFWDFLSTDGKHRDPTSGFVHVSSAPELWNAVCAAPSPVTMMSGDVQIITSPPGACTQFKATPGTVVVVDPQAHPGDSLNLGGYPAIILPAGVTLRGDRRGILFGSQLSMLPGLQVERNSPSDDTPLLGGFGECGWCMIETHGDYVRITGLRLEGGSSSTDKTANQTVAIQIDYPLISPQQSTSATEYITAIDHDEIFAWPSEGVNVVGDFNKLTTCPAGGNDERRQSNVQIFRDFIHHQQREGGSYGVVVTGGRADVVGNTFLLNWHSIAGNGDARDEYTALYNIILSDSHDYGASEGFHEQDFDMHGVGEGGYGGVAGDRIEIAGNLFLGGDRFNFELRGHPCFVSSFHDNLTAKFFFPIGNVSVPINLHSTGMPPIDIVNIGPNEPAYPIQLYPVVGATLPIAIGGATYSEQVVLSARNQYPNVTPAFQDPTNTLRVGDFDGDGVQDLFIASGTAWYYAPGGATEWRFLSAKNQTVGDLLFGDFDGDGRTDVVTLNGQTLMISWGGVSDWEVLNPTPFTGQIGDLQVGNFTGDARDDLFWADGSTWRVSDHGAEPFVHSQTSSFHVKDLRFGDFNGDGKTDVFAIVSGKWQVSYAATSSWTPLPVSLTSNVNNLAVADFDGDGRADILLSDGATWYLSRGGASPWLHRTIQTNDVCGVLPSITNAAAIGRFQALPTAQVLIWQGYTYSIQGQTHVSLGKTLCSMQGGLSDPQGWSRVPMR